MAAGSRRIAGNVLLLLVVSVVLVAFLELLGRYVFLKGPLYFAVTDVDHRPKPEWSEGINEDGIRARFEASDIPEDAFRIIMLGDSFVEGLYLDAHQSIPARLEKRIRETHPGRSVAVLNFGWLSASPLLIHRQVKEIAAKYEPDLVVHCLDMTDFHDDLRYRRLLERDGAFWWLNVTPVTFLLIKEAAERLGPIHDAVFGYPANRFFHSNQPLDASRPYLEPLSDNLSALSQTVTAELGAPYVLVLFPRNYQYSKNESPESWEKGEYEPLGEHVHEPFRYFEEIEPTLGFPVYSLLEVFRRTPAFPTCFPHDPHWNATGAAIAAEAIHDTLAANGHLDALRSD